MIKFEETDPPKYNATTSKDNVSTPLENELISDSKQDSRKKDDLPIKECPICHKTYSCNSSLNLHLKRKHQQKKR